MICTVRTQGGHSFVVDDSRASVNEELGRAAPWIELVLFDTLESGIAKPLRRATVMKAAILAVEDTHV